MKTLKKLQNADVLPKEKDFNDISAEREHSKTLLVNIFAIVSISAVVLFILTGITFSTGRILFELSVIAMMLVPLYLNRINKPQYARLILVLAIDLALIIALFVQEYSKSIKFGVIIPFALGSWFFHKQDQPKLLLSYTISIVYLIMAFSKEFASIHLLMPAERAALFYDLAYYAAIVTVMILFQFYYTTNMLRIEQTLQERLLYERAISKFTESLLQDAHDDFDTGLSFLLEASGASRVYVFENEIGNAGEILTSQTHEQCLPGVAPQIGNPSLQRFSYSDAGVERWMISFQNGQYIQGNVIDFPASEQNILKKQGIMSVLVLPFRINQQWAGIIGFDQVDNTRSWSELDIQLLLTAANIIGIYFESRKQKVLLHQNNLQLTELNETKDKLFSIIAHDLINPFHSMIGLSDLLKSSLEENDSTTCTELTFYINQTAVNTFRLLENLLTWSRAQSGKITYTPNYFEVTGLLDKVTELLKPMAKTKKVELINEVNGPLVMLADISMLDIVFRNLISNAIKFTPEGGKVVLSHRNMPDLSHLFMVKDTGIGIEPDRIKTLFANDKGNSTDGTSGEKGTGLGLMLCNDFVRQHHGSITVESEPGKGTSFLLNFPAKEPMETL